MLALNYTRYFFYLALNWNWRIARHILKHEIKGEKKYGIKSTGADELTSLAKKGIDTSHATIYMPASYDIAEELFQNIAAENLQHFVDIGCGKGRAMCMAASFGFKQVTGIDFSAEFCKAATENLVKTKTKFPALSYRVINNDAFYFNMPRDADCIFLFNPFDEVVMSAVLQNIEKHRKRTRKSIHIIYLNPLHKALFLNMGYQEIFHTKKLNYLEGCILKK